MQTTVRQVIPLILTYSQFGKPCISCATVIKNSQNSENSGNSELEHTPLSATGLILAVPCTHSPGAEQVTK